ncbi:MAG: Uma2 family endonuclease [Rhodospirillales bacterium]|nr:Uma2 family endonuclease [Rhodospirillales bacterium]
MATDLSGKPGYADAMYRSSETASPMAGAQPATHDRHEGSAATRLLVRLQPALCPTEDEFYEFCRINRELRIERNARGGIAVMGPAGWETAERNAQITFQLMGWATADGTGRAADSSAGYLLPNGAMRSPDASWISNERLASVAPEQRSKFLPLCPDFVIELRSPTDRLGRLQEKMAEYMANGAQLGWLIDPSSRQVFVYRGGSEVETLDAPDRVSGAPLLEGFRLRTESIW